MVSAQLILSTLFDQIDYEGDVGRTQQVCNEALPQKQKNIAYSM